MSAPFNQIKRKIEDGCKLLIQARARADLKALPIFVGKDSTELTSPRIEIYAAIATAEVFADTVTGNWMVEIAISMVTNYKDTSREVRTLLEAEMIDIFLDDEFVKTINTIDGPEFTIHGGDGGAGEGIGFDEPVIESFVNGEHEHMETLTGTIYCRPSLEDNG